MGWSASLVAINHVPAIIVKLLRYSFSHKICILDLTVVLTSVELSLVSNLRPTSKKLNLRLVAYQNKY